MKISCAFALLSALALLATLGAMVAQAGPPPALRGERWLPLGSLSPDRPALTLLSADEQAITLRAEFPGVWAADLSSEGQPYTRLYGPGYGHGSEIGRPDLPVLRREVEIPFGAEVTLEVLEATCTDSTLAEAGLFPIYPLQPPVPKVPGAEKRPLTVDGDFYRDGGLYPQTPLTFGEPYVIRGHRILPVEVWPVAYDPAAPALRLCRSFTFRLKLAGSDMALTRSLADRYASPVFEAALSRRVLNFRQGRPPVEFAPDTPVGYLIITADAYYNAILPLANLREGRGFDVTVTRCSEIAGGCLSTAAVKAYIQNAYNNWPVPPSYVLLVGDTDTIATYTGPVIGTSTDLYYGCMDPGDDWHPDIGRGRFPVRSPAQTTSMVNKYLAYAELTGSEPWLKTASFPATCDQYQIAEGTHNYVISSYTAPGGYTGNFPQPNNPGGDKLYCITYGATHNDLVNMFNQGRWVIIYSGHGSYDGWEMDFTPNDVRNLTNYGMFPFVASHACLSGDFGQPEVFGETWVLQDNKGGLVYWGSSTYSYWDEDDVLERAMFDSLFTVTPHPAVARMTDDGLAAVESAYPSSARYYWETYNVLGDPAVKVFLEPELPTFTFEATPAEHALCSSGVVTFSLIVRSLLGYSETVYLEVGDLPAGLTATIVPTSAPAPFTATLTLEVAAGTPAGDYPILITATDAISWTHDAQVLLHLATAPPDAPALLSPPDGAPDQPFRPTFEWSESPWARSYRLQVDASPLFPAPLLDVSGLVDTSYTAPEPLAGGGCYWWRLLGENACGSGPWAVPFHFATVALGVAFSDDMESGSGQWSHGAAQGSDHWQLSTAQSHSPTHSWFVPDDGVVTDSRLWNTVAVPLGAGSTLTFWHRYQFEGTSYDGSVLEISTNGGGTWSDLGPYITGGGYNGTISTCCSNPLGGRQAWVGDLTEWTQVTVDLGAFAGQSALIRWRIGCDSSVSDVGWYIDDVEITSPLPPNPAPTLERVTPNYGPYGQATPVQVEGSGFLPTPDLKLGETWLLSVTLVSSTTLDAVVPAGLEPGTYTLTLYNGDCQEVILPNAFSVIAGCISPTASLSSNSPVELGSPMYFTATVQGTPEFTYTWDFGGPGYGSGLDGPTPAYTYTTYGLFTVTVYVSNACGMDEARLPVEVLCFAPQATFTSDSPVILGRPMHFTSTVSGTGPFTYTWDFGDGLGTSHDPNPVYTYTTAGEFTVSLTVEGACGSAVTRTAVAVLPPCAPVEIITYTAQVSGCLAAFGAELSGDPPFAYLWDFGAFGTYTEANPTVDFSATGTYTGTLQVWNCTGQYSDTTALEVSVECAPPVRYHFIYLPLVLRNAQP